MNQVGHANSEMTLDVYAQLQQRVKREHGASFDRLIREARTQLYGDDEPPAGGVCADVCAGDTKTAPKRRPARRPTRGQNLRISRHNRRWRDPDSNRGTPRFSGVVKPYRPAVRRVAKAQ